MPLAQLSPDQIRAWTREQKDRWWLANIFRGDLPQLTLRSGFTGFLLGGILSATNLYVGGKSGVTLGVTLTSVILAFALFRALTRVGLAKDFTILENNAMQSIATAAGCMTTPLVASLSAYMLVTGVIIPWWQMIAWMTVMSLLGVLVAFPMKRRFINEDQLPFPEGRACAVVLDALHRGDGGEGVYKARLLGAAASLSAGYQFLCGSALQRLVQFKILRLDRLLGWKEPWHLHERLDDYYYQLAGKWGLPIPAILGTDARTLGLRVGLDVTMLGVGGLMGVRVASSVLLGTLLNTAVLAPWMIARGDIAPRLLAGGSGAPVPLSRAEIVNQWGLWWAVAMMVVGSLVSLAARPEVFAGVFHLLRGSRRDPAGAAAAAAGPDVLAHIELPRWVSYAGVPVLGLVGCGLTHWFFGVPLLLAIGSLPLMFLLALICAHAMALTSWTLTGPLSKITQFSVGALDRANPASNLITAGMTAEIAVNASHLLSDLKPGYMLGAKPRQQAIGHVIGIFSGAVAVTPLFFLLFLPPGPDGARSTATLVSDQFPMPAAMQWKGVADLIARGVASLPASAVTAMVVAAVAAAGIEVFSILRRRTFPLSPVSIGLGVVLPPESCLVMWLGAMFFWWQARRYPQPGTPGNRRWVEGAEPICAGLITGAALLGIANALANVLFH